VTARGRWKRGERGCNLLPRQGVARKKKSAWPACASRSLEERGKEHSYALVRDFSCPPERERKGGPVPGRACRKGRKWPSTGQEKLTCHWEGKNSSLLPWGGGEDSRSSSLAGRNWSRTCLVLCGRGKKGERDCSPYASSALAGTKEKVGPHGRLIAMQGRGRREAAAPSGTGRRKREQIGTVRSASRPKKRGEADSS